MEQLTPIIIFAIVGFTVIGLITFLSNNQSLNGIKNKVVGDGQHGTAKFANEKEIKEVYKIIDYTPDLLREGKNLPTVEGLIVGSKTIKNKTKAIVDSGDIHALMIGSISTFVKQKPKSEILFAHLCDTWSRKDCLFFISKYRVLFSLWNEFYDNRYKRGYNEKLWKYC